MDTHSIAIIVTNLAAIIGVGVALAGLMLRQGARLERRIDGLQEQMGSRIDGLQEQMNQRFDAMQEQMNQHFEAMKDQIADLRERVARIEGMLTRQPASAEEAMRAQAGS